MTTDLNALFDSFTVSAFRLETLPAYDIGGDEAERLAAYLTCRPRPERSVRTSPWLARIARTTAEGKTWQRVRIVDNPLTEYQRYQLESYRESQAVGEEIRIVERSDVEVPNQDFWLLDGELVVVLQYDDEGRFVETQTAAGPDVEAEFKRRRDRALVQSVPLNEFLAKAARV